MYIVRLYKWRLLEVDILAGVFLVSFCVEPSDAKGNSLSVVWSSNCFSAASSSELTLTSFKTPVLEKAAPENGQLLFHGSL